MTQNTPVVVGGNIEGNIGSCDVKSTYINIDSWHKQTMAVNSCTGQVVYQSPIYYDWSYIYFPLAFVLVFVATIASLRVLFD